MWTKYSPYKVLFQDIIKFIYCHFSKMFC